MSSDEGLDDGDEEEGETATSSSICHQEKNQEEEFHQSLVDFAIWHQRRGYLRMLKVLFRDVVNSNDELARVTSVLDLLNCLIGPGKLGPTNSTILCETVKVTGQTGFISTIRDEHSPFKDIKKLKVSTFTQFRQNLVKLGKLLTREDIDAIDGSYNLLMGLRKYEDSWDLITDLENRGKLSEGNMDSFIRVLRRRKMKLAVKTLLSGDYKSKSQVMKRSQTDDNDDEIEPPEFKKRKSVLPGNADMKIREYLLERQHLLCRNASRFKPAILNPRYQVDIAHMFTDLDLLKENKRKIDPKPIQLGEVLSIIKTQYACKVLIDGEGGIGKTTLLRYLAYRWAAGLDDTFKGKIVFPVNIRDIKNDDDVLDVLVRQIKLKHFNLQTGLPKNPKLIKKFITKNDHEIVLLLDGLDELGIGMENPIALFRKEELKNSVVILTSRSEKIDDFINESCVHVKVKGFSADNIKIYIKKHFDFFEIPTLGESLIEELDLDEEDERFRGDKHPEVYSMCKNPMLLLSICIMWEETKTLPSDKTFLFKEVFRSILNQYNRSENNEQNNISNFENAPTKFINAMLVLGKCMFHGLKINQIYITRNSLRGNKKAIALALKLGFVYKDDPNSKTSFEDVYSAPHKLIVEALVGFYLYKLSQEASFKRGPETTRKILNPLSECDWEIIRESEHFIVAREFAIGFLGSDASLFLNHWITNNFQTYRTLMTQLKLVKEEYRTIVENSINDHMNTTDLGIKLHIHNVRTSLKKCVHYLNPDVSVNDDDHFIKLIRTIHGIGPMRAGPLTGWHHEETQTLINGICGERSPKAKGIMLAHAMVVAPNQNMFLEKINETCNDDVFEHLVEECQKLNFKYDITNYTLYESSLSSSYMVHLLNNAPKLKFLNLDVSITGHVANDMFAECVNKGVTTKLQKIFIRDSDLSAIKGALLASLLNFAPALNHLCLVKCNLSGFIINEMIRKCYSRGIPLILDALDISDNNLSDLSGSLLASLMIIAPKLIFLDMHNCSLPGEAFNDMENSFSRRVGVILELEELCISDNNFTDINGSSLAYIINIAPKLKNLEMTNCKINSDAVNSMTGNISEDRAGLLETLLISDNVLSNVDGFSLGTFLGQAPNLSNIGMSNCLSGLTLNDLSRKCSISEIKMEINSLNIEGSDLSTINGSSLGSLCISLQPYFLDLSKCRLSGHIMNDMITELSTKTGTKLKLNHLNINENSLGDINGSSLASLITVAPSLDMLYMRDSNLSGVIIADMASKCVSNNIVLKLIYLDISGNNLSSINGCSLADLLAISPKLQYLYMHKCKLSGDIMNNMISECIKREVNLKLSGLGISCNDLSNLDNALFTSLLTITPDLDSVYLHNCSIPDDKITDITSEFSSRGVDVILDDDDDETGDQELLEDDVSDHSFSDMKYEF